MKKKEKILNYILENNTLNSSCIYSLVKKGFLDDVISKMNNEIIVSNTNNLDTYLPEEHFACLLWRLVNCINDDFLLGSNLPLIVENIIVGCNKEYLTEYLLTKHYFGDNKFLSFFEFQISRIEICNFINNFRYFNKELQELVLENTIIFKDFDINKKQDIIYVKEKLKKISLANYDEKFSKCFLFENIEKRLYEYENVICKSSFNKNRNVLDNFNTHIFNLCQKFCDSVWNIQDENALIVEKNYKDIILEDNCPLRIINKSNDEYCHIIKFNNIMLLEEVPFCEVMNLSIEYNTFSQRKKKTINGIDAKVYIDNFLKKYHNIK